MLSMLCSVFRSSGGGVPYRKWFIVGPKSPRGLIAKGMSCMLSE